MFGASCFALLVEGDLGRGERRRAKMFDASCLALLSWTIVLVMVPIWLWSDSNSWGPWRGEVAEGRRRSSLSDAAEPLVEP